jgi:hypothetical protein
MLQTANPISTYNATLSDYKGATVRMEKLRDIVVLAGHLLHGKGWQSAMVAGFPAPPGLSEQTFLIGPEWPSLQELGQAIATWRQCRQEMVDAWQAVPLRIQSYLEPPPQP